MSKHKIKHIINQISPHTDKNTTNSRQSKCKSNPFPLASFLFNSKQSSSTRKMKNSKNHHINSGNNIPSVGSKNMANLKSI